MAGFPIAVFPPAGKFMNPVARLLIGLGILLIIIGLFWGLFWQFGGRSLHLGKLPGDIAIEKENFRFYFPVTTSILISIVLSFVLYLIRLMSK
jgi:hypothetical protein